MLKKSKAIYVGLLTFSCIITSSGFFGIDSALLRSFLLLILTICILIHVLYAILRQDYGIRYTLNDLFLPILLLISLIHILLSTKNSLITTLIHPINGPLILLISTILYFALSKPKLHKKWVMIIYTCSIIILLLLNFKNVLGADTETFASFKNSLSTIQIQCLNVKQCVFGIGINQFPLFFAHVKNMEYVRSNLWNISTFQYSHSLFTQFLNELGLITLLPFILIFLQIGIDSTRRKSLGKTALKLMGLFTILIVFPPSTELVLLLTLFLALIKRGNYDEEKIKSHKLSQTHLLLLLAAALTFCLWSFIQLSFFIKADVAYSASLNKNNTSNIKTRYDLQKKALHDKPDVTKYHIGFVQTNREILAAFDKKYSATSSKMNQQDQLAITQTTQTLIKEVQTIVQLNPNNPESYAFMGEIYASLMQTTPQSYQWSIAAYEKAVELDPYNLVYLHRLAQISLDHKSYKQSLTFAQRALTMRKDQASTYIAIAQAFQGLGKKQEAIKTVEYALSSLNNINEREKSILSSLYNDVK